MICKNCCGTHLRTNHESFFCNSVWLSQGRGRYRDHLSPDTSTPTIKPKMIKPEKDATFMLLLSIPVCCPGLCFTVTREKPLQLSGPCSDNAWFRSSREPTQWANKPKEPKSCSQLRISQCREHRLMWLRSSSSKNWRSSRRPVDLNNHA